MLELAGEEKLARDLVAGGLFVPGYAMPLNEDCELILRGPGGAELRVAGRVVFANEAGIGVQLENCDADMKQRITALASAPVDAEPEPEPAETTPLSVEEIEAAQTAAAAAGATAAPADAEPDSADDKKTAANMHERLRGLNLAQQVKLAHHGELAERILLERLYGKSVWEALLRNPRVTGPEVARIARMGSLPRPMMEIILNNGGWLQIPEVRRALLTNPRLGTDQILRILRLLPKHEIKMATTQTIYPLAVRDAAKRLMKELGHG